MLEFELHALCHNLECLLLSSLLPHPPFPFFVILSWHSSNSLTSSALLHCPYSFIFIFPLPLSQTPRPCLIHSFIISLSLFSSSVIYLLLSFSLIPDWGPGVWGNNTDGIHVASSHGDCRLHCCNTGTCKMAIGRQFLAKRFAWCKYNTNKYQNSWILWPSWYCSISTTPANTKPHSYKFEVLFFKRFFRSMSNIPYSLIPGWSPHAGWKLTSLALRQQLETHLLTGVRWNWTLKQLVTKTKQWGKSLYSTLVLGTVEWGHYYLLFWTSPFILTLTKSIVSWKIMIHTWLLGTLMEHSCRLCLTVLRMFY